MSLFILGVMCINMLLLYSYIVIYNKIKVIIIIIIIIVTVIVIIIIKRIKFQAIFQQPTLGFLLCKLIAIYIVKKRKRKKKRTTPGITEI